jgi:hypothetical protein
MSHLNYGFEKFSHAVHALDASSKPIKERLFDATYHLGVLPEQHVPEEMRGQFTYIAERLKSGVPRSGEGTLAATINQITEEEAIEIAGDIVSFNDDLILWHGRNWGKVSG